MQTPQLPNNKKPATHFIEWWKGRYQYHQTGIDTINELKASLNATFKLAHKTIAIFKIRYK